MNENQKQLLDLDLYALLDVEDTASQEQIKKAYRKKALELHPDKNPQDKEGAEARFVQLGKVFEILSDTAAKAAYDAIKRGRKERAKKIEQLDDKRRKFKEDLEARERTAAEKANRPVTKNATTNEDEERFKREVERLRKEGSRILEEEMNQIKEQLRKLRDENKDTLKEQKQQKTPRMKASWTSKAFRSGLNVDLLRHLFEYYGEIEILLMSEKKNSSIVEYKNLNDAIKAYKDRANLQQKYSINITWLGPDLDVIDVTDTKKESQSSIPNEHANLSFDDMEAAILKKLKQSN
jgi:DnaJ homolog subfamily C member 17